MSEVEAINTVDAVDENTNENVVEKAGKKKKPNNKKAKQAASE